MVSRAACECEASWHVAQMLDSESYAQSIAQWNAHQMGGLMAQLQRYGCASHLSCEQVAHVGGVVSLDRVLFELECTVFVPHALVEEHVVAYIEALIDAEQDRIFVTTSESDDAGIESQGRTVDVLVLYLNASARDELFAEWSANVSAFGEGSVMEAVSARDVNETVRYLGSEVFDEAHGEAGERDTQAALLGVTLLVIIVSVALLAMVLICRKDQLCNRGHRFESI